MKHITFTMSDDLAEAVERYRNAQDAPPSSISVRAVVFAGAEDTRHYTGA